MPRRLFATLVLAAICGCDPHAAHRPPPPQAPPAKGTVAERVAILVASQMGISPRNLDEDSRLNEDLGLDDLDRVELVMELEEEFGITLDDETAASFRTVGDVTRAVSKRTHKLRMTSDGIPIRP